MQAFAVMPESIPSFQIKVPARARPGITSNLATSQDTNRSASGDLWNEVRGFLAVNGKVTEKTFFGEMILFPNRSVLGIFPISGPSCTKNKTPTVSVGEVSGGKGIVYFTLTSFSSISIRSMRERKKTFFEMKFDS